MKGYKYIVFLLVLFISTNVLAQPLGHMTPLPSERLAKPIVLNKSCNNVSIVEWKYTKRFLDSTSPNKKSINIINEACNLAVNNFYKFMDTQPNYSISLKTRKKKLKVTISLLPAKRGRDGTLPRSLNDLNYRFVYRTKTYDGLGRPNLIWGYYQRFANHIYIRNDVLHDGGTLKNNRFVVIFAHEIFHAMSYNNGVFNQHMPVTEQNNIEEDMSMRFTKFLLGSI